MTHYREGSHLSDKPVTVDDAPLDFDKKYVVKLKWQATERAVSFDILRTKPNQPPVLGKPCKCAVAKNERFSHLSGEIIDNKKDHELEEVTLPNENIAVFTRITRAGRNLRAFHKAKLDCIRYEAGVPKTDPDAKCNPKLSTTPIEGRPY